MEILTNMCMITIAVICIISYMIYKWNYKTKSRGNLPPGSTGLPYIGETIQFFTPYSFYDIPPFITKRVSRYGSLFMTSIVGQKIVVSTDAEVNNYIFQQEDKLFECFYTDTFVKLLGADSVLAYHGNLHKYIKNLILKLVSPESLRNNLLHEMDLFTSDALSSWSRHGHVEVKEASADMVFDYAAKKLISYDKTKATCKKSLRENFKDFMDGLISFPINIPGTAFHSCLQGRKNAMEVITNVFNERLTSNKLGDRTDFLDYLVEEINDKDTILTQGIAADLVFVILFAIYETTSTAITLATKFLADHPAALAKLTKEHENILQNRSDQEVTSITWKEYKSMSFTHMVINETVRLANIVPGIFRRVIKDVELKGYTIPKGLIMMICPSTLHLNPSKYNDPLAFNPWRWEGKELHAATKDFMAFGGGVRLCVGADFAKLQMAIYLHYLVTKYRWRVTKGGDIIRKPGLMFPNGLHMEISVLDQN